MTLLVEIMKFSLSISRLDGEKRLAAQDGEGGVARDDNDPVSSAQGRQR